MSCRRSATGLACGLRRVTRSRWRRSGRCARLSASVPCRDNAGIREVATHEPAHGFEAGPVVAPQATFGLVAVRETQRTEGMEVAAETVAVDGDDFDGFGVGVPEHPFAGD